MKMCKMKIGQQSISRIMLGTGSFTTLDKKNTAFEILDEYLALGGNCIDTARHYGMSETIIGEWLKSRKCRQKVFLLTKGAHPNNESPNINRLKQEAIQRDLETSLGSLETEKVDAYALHRDDETIPVSRVMHMLHELVQEGKTEIIGASNWKTKRIKQANDYALAHNLTPFSFSSPGYSLAKAQKPRWAGCVTINEESHTWHQGTNFPVFAWSPQASGFFSDKYPPQSLVGTELGSIYSSPENCERLERVKLLSRKLNVSTNEVALAYVLNQPFPTVAIVGASKKEQLKTAFAAVNIVLSLSQLDWLSLKSDI